MSGRLSLRPAATPVAAARFATTWLFLANGLVLATWFTRIPKAKADLGLTNGALGTALLAAALGALLAMQLAGRLTARFGSAPVVRCVAVACPVTLLGPAFAQEFWQLAAALFVLGAVNGVLDVTMNTHGIAVERALGRPLMNSFHAAWSIGGAAGAVSAGIAARIRWDLPAHFVTVAALVVAVTLVATRSLLSAEADRATAQGEGEPVRPSSWRRGWTRRVALLGLLGLCCLLAEGAAADWSAVYLAEERDASAAVASVGYGAFATMMTIGRLVGDRLHQWFGPVRLVRRSALLAASGLAAGLAMPGQLAAIIGLALLGVGMSVLVPVLFSAAGHGSPGQDESRSSAGIAVAHVATLSYFGVLAGPPLIGWLAEATGLGWALALPVVLLLLVAAGAGVTAIADRSGSERPHRSVGDPASVYPA